MGSPLPYDSGPQYATLLSAIASEHADQLPMYWRSRAAAVSSITIFSGVSADVAEAARCILFAALCDGVVLDHDELTKRVNDRVQLFERTRQQRRTIEPTKISNDTRADDSREDREQRIRIDGAASLDQRIRWAGVGVRRRAA
jgi:hypothetical protein